jgi:hypothetical protein
VHFQFSHEFDVPLAVVEQAVMSAELPHLLGRRLGWLRSIDTMAHQLEDGVLSRVWRFRARQPLPIPNAQAVTADMMVWDEHWRYRVADHSALWFVVPRPEAEADAGWRRRFDSTGDYELRAISASRTRRTVAGGLKVQLSFVGRAVERLALRELREIYGAEADTLRALCNRS